MRQIYSSASPWEPIVGYSRAVRVGTHIYIAGTTAIGDDGEIIGIADAAQQTRFILRKIETALKSLGGHLRDVVRTRMYVTDITHWEAIGRVHGEAFGTIRPAATMVEVSRLIDPRLLVEIEAEALIAAP